MALILFWSQKRILLVKNRKNKHPHWILHIQLSLSTDFLLNLTILYFWTKFFQKCHFRLMTEKSDHHHWILHIRISPGTKFQLKLTILIFWTKFAQKGNFHSRKENLPSPLILHIQITLDTKFQFKLTFSIFWTKFAQKGYFQLKTGKVNTNIDLCIFELVSVSNFSLN